MLHVIISLRFLVHGYGSKLVQTTWGEATFSGLEQLCITAVTSRRLPTCSNEHKSLESHSFLFHPVMFWINKLWINTNLEIYKRGDANTVYSVNSKKASQKYRQIVLLLFFAANTVLWINIDDECNNYHQK